MSKKSRSTAGLTVLEMLISTALVCLVMVAATALILASARFTIRAMESAALHGALTRVFRVLDDDVRLAKSLPGEASGYVASSDTLILEDAYERRTVYFVSEGGLERLDLSGEEARSTILARDLTSFMFETRGNLVCYSFSTYQRHSRTSRDWEACVRAGL